MHDQNILIFSPIFKKVAAKFPGPAQQQFLIGWIIFAEEPATSEIIPEEKGSVSHETKAFEAIQHGPGTNDSGIAHCKWHFQVVTAQT